MSIFIQKTKDRNQFVKKVLEKLAKNFEGKVFVKPNVVSFEPYPTTTHPETLRAVLEYFSDSDVCVADAPAPDAGNPWKIMEEHALNEVCKEFGVNFVNLYGKEMVKKRTKSEFELEFSGFPLSFGLLISLPVLKAHGVCGITGALKNQFGLLSAEERKNLHRGKKDIHKAIAELNRLVKFQIFLIDAVETLINAQEVRWGGKRRELGYMLAGKDPVSLDVFGLKLLKLVDPGLKGRKWSEIRHIFHAVELGVGNPEPKICKF